MVSESDKVKIWEGIKALANMSADEYADAIHMLDEAGWEASAEAQEVLLMIVEISEDWRKFLHREIPQNASRTC